MILLLSPSKTLDFSYRIRDDYTNPDFLEESKELIGVLRKFTVSEITKLMGLSKNLASLNHQRYLDFAIPFNLDNSRQAIYAFKGDVYDGLKAESFTPTDVKYAQSHLRIISGLYGLLRPLDLIQPYRLEMKTKLPTEKGKNLYEYWGNSITTKLNELLKGRNNKLLINLASIEYFKAINKKLLQGKVISVVFKEKNKGYKVVPLFAKKARGVMASYIIKNQIHTISEIKQFNKNGYSFNESMSTEDELVFIR